MSLRAFTWTEKRGRLRATWHLVCVANTEQEVASLAGYGDWHAMPTMSITTEAPPIAWAHPLHIFAQRQPDGQWVKEA